MDGMKIPGIIFNLRFGASSHACAARNCTWGEVDRKIDPQKYPLG